MKRSAQPFPSGARTNAGELSIPRKRSSFRKSPAMYCEPWSWRTARPRATSFAKPPKWRRTPLPERLQRLEAVGAAAGVDADALGRAVVDGDEHGRLALAGDRGGQVGAPHRVDRLGDDGAPSRPRGPRGAPVREGASRPCPRISRSTRRLEVRV